jgi:hypothetical protein
MTQLVRCHEPVGFVEAVHHTCLTAARIHGGNDALTRIVERLSRFYERLYRIVEQLTLFVERSDRIVASLGPRVDVFDRIITPRDRMIAAFIRNCDAFDRIIIAFVRQCRPFRSQHRSFERIVNRFGRIGDPFDRRDARSLGIAVAKHSQTLWPVDCGTLRCA